MIILTRFFFRISKALHKYTGLFFLLYFILTGITGILINHPNLLRSFSVPLFLTPSGYHYTNWNRMAMRETAFSMEEAKTHYICGKEGVWQTKDEGKTYIKIKKGFPTSASGKDTNCLLLDKQDKTSVIYAGTGEGIYFCTEEKLIWERAKFKDKEPSEPEITDIIKTRDMILAFTEHACYRINRVNQKPLLSLYHIPSDIRPLDKVPLYRLFFKIHDGSITGISGRLIMDAAALIMIFLCISAVYIWYMPWKKKHFKRRYFSKPALFRFFNKYHLKLGIYSALFISAVSLTGMFMRPPLIASIAKYRVSSVWLDLSKKSSDLNFTVNKAVYMPESDSIIIAAGDNRFIKGPADFSQPFTEADINVPVHGMGVNTLEALNNSRLLVGSFSGFFIWNDLNKTAEDLTGKAVQPGIRGRTNMKGMSAGAAVKNGSLSFAADYQKGIKNINSSIIPAMPKQTVTHGSMTLFQFLFEIHNGRIFRGLFGNLTWIIVPLGGFLLLLTALTGVYDWLYRKL